MPLNFIFPDRRSAVAETLSVNGRAIPLLIVRNVRARRYVLRAQPDGSARLTIPRGGSAEEARRFADRHKTWLERQWQRFALRPQRPKEWVAGMDILFRGDPVKIERGINGHSGSIRLGNEWIHAGETSIDLRPAIEKHLRRLAMKELPARVLEHAALHRLSVRRITVRDQRTRWGSCSTRGVISLNWRLIQTPSFVRDYIILHELMHLRQMDHSRRFWSEVAQVCPDYKTARQWLKQNPGLLRP